MTKLEYLKQLELGLRDKITEQETYDIMRDYAEYFEEGKTEGKTEKEIIESLGSPQAVVAQILDEQTNTSDEEKPSDRFINSVKVKYNSIKQKLQKDKIENEKRREQQRQVDAEDKHIRQQNAGYSNKKPKRQRSGVRGVANTIFMVILWIFIIVPFVTSIFGTGALMTILGIGGLLGISTVAAFLVPSIVCSGIFMSLSMLFFGVTVVLLGVIFIKFCINKTFGEPEPNVKDEPKDDFQNQDFNIENDEGEENENA